MRSLAASSLVFVMIATGRLFGQAAVSPKASEAAVAEQKQPSKDRSQEGKKDGDIIWECWISNKRADHD